eukprot:gnl/TRDRNA2_/TRDRNA2_187525_c0_seq1.p1 gnl/TRDRNA2_/TRDRNA2_187525_c0~~gnl/TRDRNA2_/TRDRNA2_187525_c0_seq1.p1  ORF type:complete len:238 (+),score=53.62 gnl/TRDRNA2_/TRDRNA2_187525_c0_seq1:90-803(+)
MADDWDPFADPAEDTRHLQAPTRPPFAVEPAEEDVSRANDRGSSTGAHQRGYSASSGAGSSGTIDWDIDVLASGAPALPLRQQASKQANPVKPTTVMPDGGNRRGYGQFGLVSESSSVVRDAGKSAKGGNASSLEGILAHIDELDEIEKVAEAAIAAVPAERWCPGCEVETDASTGRTDDDGTWYCSGCWMSWDLAADWQPSASGRQSENSWPMRPHGDTASLKASREAARVRKVLD